jgi:antitoxin PrlF
LQFNLDFLQKWYYDFGMKSLVTSKGQVTIPKPLRDEFGIEPGAEVDFDAAPDGIRIRKVVDRTKRKAALGCLKEELAGRSVEEWLDELRGAVELPRSRRKGKQP